MVSDIAVLMPFHFEEHIQVYAIVLYLLKKKGGFDGSRVGFVTGQTNFTLKYQGQGCMLWQQNKTPNMTEDSGIQWKICSPFTCSAR